jgi:hypothetical protein
MSWMFGRVEQTAFYDKAWKRSEMAAWDERWAKLSVAARKLFVTKVKLPAYIGAQKPINPTNSFDPAIVQEWRDAGLILDERRGATAGFVVADAALGFANRIRTLKRFRLLDPEHSVDLMVYVTHCFSTYTLATELDKIVEKQTGLSRYALAGDLYEMFVKRRRWPDWVAAFLRDSLARPILNAIEQAGGKLPLLRLADHFSGQEPSEVRATVDNLVSHLALFEDIDPDTFEVFIGLLPSVLADRRLAAKPAVIPPLAPSPPAETGPEGGLLIPDMRAALLEVAGQPPRLKQDFSLYQKEMERFIAALDPRPSWLEGSEPGEQPPRVARALALANQAGLTQAVRGETDAVLLGLTAEGREWLSLGVEAQYTRVFRFFDKGTGPGQWRSADDSWFLGSNITSTPRKGTKQERSYRPLTDAERKAFREAVYRAFAELPVGTFFRVDDFLAHVALGPNNPVLLGGQVNQVLVRKDGRMVPPLEEHMVEAGRALLRSVITVRLALLGCVQLGRDAKRQLVFARLPRLDVYFGKAEAVPEAPAADTRVVVQPDFSVIIIGLSPAPVAELAPFCERVRGQASQGSITFRITRESVIKGLAAGLPPEAVLERLQKHSSTPLPKNVATEVAGWCSWMRRVTPAPALLLRCGDSATADRVMGAVGKQGERIGESIVAIPADGLTSALRQKLRGQGILLDGETLRKKKR